ncbi:MAG: hypothetical protein FWB76_01265 [Oscillospiraceae bacterium]|nr:hypothetical protein [Oscillospiraceae bacterium]
MMMKRALSVALAVLLGMALFVPASAVDCSCALGYACEEVYGEVNDEPTTPPDEADDNDDYVFGSIQRPGDSVPQIVMLFLYDLFGMIVSFVGGLFTTFVVFLGDFLGAIVQFLGSLFFLILSFIYRLFTR